MINLYSISPSTKYAWRHCISVSRCHQVSLASPHVSHSSRTRCVLQFHHTNTLPRNVSPFCIVLCFNSPLPKLFPVMSLPKGSQNDPLISPERMGILSCSFHRSVYGRLNTIFQCTRCYRIPSLAHNFWEKPVFQTEN